MLKPQQGVSWTYKNVSLVILLTLCIWEVSAVCHFLAAGFLAFCITCWNIMYRLHMHQALLRTSAHIIVACRAKSPESFVPKISIYPFLVISLVWLRLKDLKAPWPLPSAWNLHVAMVTDWSPVALSLPKRRDDIQQFNRVDFSFNVDGHYEHVNTPRGRPSTSVL